MSTSENSSIENLHSLYEYIGKNSSAVNYHNLKNYTYVKSINSIWPNTIFKIKDEFLENEFELSEISSKIKSKDLPPLALVYNNATNTLLLKKNGFYTIEQWILMELNIKNKVILENFTNCNIVSSDEELEEWIKVAQRILFSNNQLDKIIFKDLLKGNSKLFYIKIDNEIIGTTLCYIDKNNIAGIYMVGIYEQFRGRKLGKTLMNYTLNYLQQINITNVVLQSTKAGIPLYKNLQFNEIGIVNLIYKIK